MSSLKITSDKLSEYISHGLQEELGQRIQKALQEVANAVVLEVTEDIVKTLSHNIDSYYDLPTGTTVVNLQFIQKTK